MFIPAYRDGLRASVLRHSADAYVGYLKETSPVLPGDDSRLPSQHRAFCSLGKWTTHPTQLH